MIASRVISWKTIRCTGTLGVQHLEEKPGDGFALAILVGREVQLVGVLSAPLELAADPFSSVGVDDVERPEVVVDVDRELAEAKNFFSSFGSSEGVGRSRMWPTLACTS